MTLKIGSFIGFALAVLGILFMLKKDYILSKDPVTIMIQVCSVALMIWARLTFGVRSFHATANTTQGELVTTGPYRWLRHPIYASIIYFIWASLISHPFTDAFAAVILISGGLLLRMVLEEKSLILTYKNYPEYSKRTKRVIPFIF